MGAFLLVRSNDVSATLEAERILTRSGFKLPHTITGTDFILKAYPKIETGDLALRQFDNGDFVFASGTLVFDGKRGAEAAEAFYAETSHSTDPATKAFGHYAVIIKRGNAITIATDQFGGYQIYFDAERKVFSSSLLATTAFIKKLTCVKQSIFEYVFNGVVSGNETLFREISVLPKETVVRIRGDAIEFDHQRHPPPRHTASLSQQELIGQAIDDLDRYFSSIARAFGNRVNTALSAGYDSRLILAMLKRHHVRPALYVYGTPADPDVQIARSIAHSEQLAIESQDKEALVVPPDEFPSLVLDNFYGSDGYLWGGLFNNGAELRERARRVSGGVLALNGGGGEIYRNFFYLPDRSYPVRNLLWSFYSQFDPGSCTQAFNSDEYYTRLQSKIWELLGGVQTRLERPLIEWLYHSFRCRSWDGRVNGINGRFGYTGLPFLEATISRHASCIPIKYKDHGAFEAELICRIDPALASYPSSYGHNFVGSPPLRRIVHDRMTYLRPTALRRLTFRLKHREANRMSWNPFLAPEYISSALPRGIHYLRRLFKLEGIRNEQQFSRILSIEVALQQFDSQITCDF